MSVRVGDEIVAGGQGDMYTKAQVDALIANAIAQTTEKPGMIKPFAGTTVPTGYLLCDGSAISRTTYANLFSAIGTTYGSGDGSTTFNIPNLSNGVPFTSVTSSRLGKYITGELPDITGTYQVVAAQNNGARVMYGYGAFSVDETTTVNAFKLSSSTTTVAFSTTFAASNSKQAYKRTDNVVMAQGTCIGAYIIKY